MSQAPAISGREGERLDATVTVDSTFSSQQTQTIELRVEDGGATIHTDTQDVTLADSTDSEQITLSWPTSSGDKGVYDLFIESGQDTIQRLVEVRDNNAATLADNHWRFDEGGGSVAADSAGSFDADFGSAISWASDGDGKGGTYGILDGTGGADLGSASLSHWSHWVNSGVGAFALWINPDTTTERNELLRQDGEVSTNRSINLYRLADGRIRFEVGTSNESIDVIRLLSDPITIGADEWASIAVRANGVSATMYIDGVEVATDTVSATESGDLQGDGGLRIGDTGGASLANENHWKGGIDDLWSDQSDPGEQAIQNWYTATKDNYS